MDSLLGQLLGFFRINEVYIYLVLALLALWEIRRFAIGWEEVRSAAFGLERESAQARLNQAAILLVLLLIGGMAEFVLVSFVIPTVPGATPLLTPTLDLLATPTTTLPPGTPGIAVIPVGTATLQPGATAQTGGCIPGKLEFTFPKSGDTLSGEVTLLGSVDLPDLGFYKYEVARPGDAIWLTIQAGRVIVRQAEIGKWDTSTLQQGDYLLRLLATDNKGNVLGTCIIPIRVATSE